MTFDWLLSANGQASLAVAAAGLGIVAALNGEILRAGCSVVLAVVAGTMASIGWDQEDD